MMTTELKSCAALGMARGLLDAPELRPPLTSALRPGSCGDFARARSSSQLSDAIHKTRPRPGAELQVVSGNTSGMPGTVLITLVLSQDADQAQGMQNLCLGLTGLLLLLVFLVPEMARAQRSHSLHQPVPQVEA